MKLSYNRLVHFEGRNGYFKCSGLEIYKSLGHNSGEIDININPITSKRNSARCVIEIPKEHLQEFINKLQTFL